MPRMSAPFFKVRWIGTAAPETQIFNSASRSNVPAVRAFLDLLVSHVMEIKDVASAYDFTTERISMASRTARAT